MSIFRMAPKLTGRARNLFPRLFRWALPGRLLDQVTSPIGTYENGKEIHDTLRRDC